MNKILENKVAIVTGGAQGFGFAITEKFLASGAKVIIWAVSYTHLTLPTKRIV